VENARTTWKKKWTKGKKTIDSEAHKGNGQNGKRKKREKTIDNEAHNGNEQNEGKNKKKGG
jgi:hypothetical protein